MDDKDNNTDVKRERFSNKKRAIKRRKEENAEVSFQIEDINANSFLVKTEGVYGLVLFYHMPWTYINPYSWRLVFPSLYEKSFTGHIHKFEDAPFRFTVKADTSPFKNVVFPFEKDETYTAIILEKTNTKLLIDFGYAFEWKYGSYPLTITCKDENKGEDMFPLYNPGDEFDAVYIGNSIIGNAVFCDEDNRYLSKEHGLIGKNVMAILQFTKSGKPYLQIHNRYFGIFVMDENDDFGISCETLQNMLQTLPERQRLWCKIIDVTYYGLMQLKWLVNRTPIVRDVLIHYSDASVLKKNDPLLTEEKRALINKLVWCQPCETGYLRKFKVENQYIGTIALDANLYQDIKLTDILDTIEKIPENQQIFCKIIGIYPDGTLKLQWIVKWDARAKTLVFPNKFSEKIDITESSINYAAKLQKLKDEYVGKDFWLKTHRTSSNKLAVFFPQIGGCGKIVLSSEQYPEVALAIIRKALKELPYDALILCKILQVTGMNNVVVRWQIEEDPSAKIVFAKVNDAIEKENIKLKTNILEQQYIGKTYLLKAQKNSNEETIFWIDDENWGKIIVDRKNYRGISRPYISKAVSTIPVGEEVLCKVVNVSLNFFELRWEIESDPIAKVLFSKLEEIEKEKIKEEVAQLLLPNLNKSELKELITEEKQPVVQESKKENIKQKLKTKYGLSLGDKLWLEVKMKSKNEILFLVADKYTGVINIEEINCSDLMEKAIRKIQYGQMLLCEIINFPLNGRIELRWVLEDDPFLGKTLTKPQQIETKSEHIIKVKGKSKEIIVLQNDIDKRQTKKLFAKTSFKTSNKSEIEIEQKNAVKEEPALQEEDKEKVLPNQESKQENVEQEIDGLKIGDKLWLEAHLNQYNTPVFLIKNKYKGTISLEGMDYPKNIPNTTIQRTLSNLPDGQVLLCSIQKNLPNFHVKLRWEIEEDPSAGKLLATLNRTKIKKRKKEWKGGKIRVPQALIDKLYDPFYWVREFQMGSQQQEPEQKNIKQEDMSEVKISIAEQELTEIPLITEERKEEQDIVKINPPVLDKPKIVGTIDLNSINEKLKPKKKSHQELIKDNEERLRLEKEKQQLLKEARRAKRKTEEEEKRKVKQEERAKLRKEKKIIKREMAMQAKEKQLLSNSVKTEENKEIKENEPLIFQKEKQNDKESKIRGKLNKFIRLFSTKN